MLLRARRHTPTSDAKVQAASREMRLQAWQQRVSEYLDEVLPGAGVAVVALIAVRVQRLLHSAHAKAVSIANH